MAFAQTYETLWADPDWLAEARAWVEEQLSADGRQIAGELEQPHLMQWATALRVPTSDGVAWFKACLPELGFEREVLALMAQGRSNSAIAAALVVTDGAVEKHVSSIFTKLDLPPTESDHRRVLAVLRHLEAA